MKEIREELDEISLKIYYLENLGELLEDYYYDNLSQRGYSKGETLITIMLEKIKDLDKTILNLYDKTIEEKGR